MTKNQIDYMSAVEQQRHNQATEYETTRSNKQREANDARQIEENAAHLRRSDLINAQHYKRMDDETSRHQLETEAISRQSNAITQLHYIMTDSATQRHYERSDANTERANLISAAKVREEGRHNLQTERLTGELNSSQIRLNATQGLLNSSKSTEAIEHANFYLYDKELTRLKSQTEVMNTELTKQQALTQQAQREKLVTETVAIPWNTAANVVSGIGKFIGGFNGFSIGNTPYTATRYQSSVSYNAVTGLYE